MKIVLFAYRDCGYECLNYLLENHKKPSLVVIPKIENKNEEIFKSVKKLALSANINFYEYDMNLDDLKNEISILNPDYAFSCYFPYMIDSDILNLFNKACFNIHGGILPNYRGALSSVWSIINNEKFSGSTIHLMTNKLDCGDIVEIKKCKISEHDTGFSLYKKIEIISVSLFKKYIQSIYENNKIITVSQSLNSGNYYDRKVPFNGRIDWSWRSQEIFNYCRAMFFPPFESATSIFNGKKFEFKSVFKTNTPSMRAPGEVVSIGETTLTIATSDFDVLVDANNFNIKQFNKLNKHNKMSLCFK
jgi:methionyl-tRNA formyltransferase